MKAFAVRVIVLALASLTAPLLAAAELISPHNAISTSEETKLPSLVSNERLATLEQDTSNSADLKLELALAYDERHDARAADMYRAAASQGIGVAELRLGALYETGDGVAQSYGEAHAHYQRAVELGVQEANLRLGLLYLEGWGAPRDPKIAVDHIQRAAAAGYQPAQQVLSDMYFAGVGITADSKKALEWAERAASDRSPGALLSVGAIHLKAVSLPQDLNRARDWFQLSAEQDYSRGMLAMASTFFRPGMNAENVRIGLRWLDLAADAGNSAAAFHRAGFYLMNGREPVTAETETRARALLEQSAAAKEPAAIEVLELAKSGRTLAEAFKFVVTIPYDDRYVQRFPPAGPVGESEDRRPRPVKISRPIYPAALRLTNTEGEALVEFVVDKTGRVHESHVIRSTHPGFADLSAAAVLTWRFEPGYKMGRPVNTRIQIPIRFQLSDLGNPRPSSGWVEAPPQNSGAKPGNSFPAGWEVNQAPLDPVLNNASAEELIDALLAEAKLEPDEQSPTETNRFLPLNVPTNRFSTKPAPAKSPAMTEIVRRGIAMIPVLLDHLLDARPTQVVLDPKQQHLNGSTGPYTDTYDFRFHENGPQPTSVNSKKDATTKQGQWPYTVKVGDLCFVALGDIVNRRLYVTGPDFGNGMMFSGAFSLEINSPVESPALAAAARADWSGITSERFVEQLKSDALGSHDPKPHLADGVWHPGIDRAGAMNRLLFYFPRVGSELVESWLRRPLNHWALPSTQLSPGQPQINDTNATDLIMDLGAFRWDGLNAQVYALFQRAVDEENAVTVARAATGRLASVGSDLPLACAKRLIHQGHDDEFRSFFTTAIKRANDEYPLVLEKMKDDILKEPSPFKGANNPQLAAIDRQQKQFRIESMSKILRSPIEARSEFVNALVAGQ